MASIKIENKTHDSFDAYLASLDTEYKYDRTVQWFIDGTLYDSFTLHAYASESDFVYFYGLQSDTTYSLLARVWFDDDPNYTGTYKDFSKTVKTDPAPFPTFAWTYANANANGIPQRSSDGYKHAGYFYVSASEWNDLIDAVKPRIEKHYPNAGTGKNSPYYMEPAVPGKEFTAKQFNQVRKSIGALESTGLDDKLPNEIIKVSDLNTLMDCVNACTQ